MMRNYNENTRDKLNKKLDDFLILFSQLSCEGQIEYIHTTQFFKTIYDIGWEDSNIYNNDNKMRTEKEIINDVISKSAKWIKENVGDNVSVDFINFMNKYYE